MGEEPEDYEALNANFQTAGSKNNVGGEALHAALEREETLRMMINNSHYGNIIHREDLQAVVESLARSVREGYDSFEMEYRIITGGGSIRWVEDRTLIQRDSKGKVTHLQGIVIDVTGRKEAEKMLEIQRELGVSLSTTWNLQTMSTGAPSPSPPPRKAIVLKMRFPEIPSGATIKFDSFMASSIRIV